MPLRLYPPIHHYEPLKQPVKRALATILQANFRSVFHSIYIQALSAHKRTRKRLILDIEKGG